MLVCPLCRIALGPSETTCPRDGKQGQEAELDAVSPDLAERFKVVEPFALGATGTLYLADEVQTGRRGLLKLLHHKGPASSADRQRLKRELVKQATLSNPHLALPLVTGETAGATWLFREWVDGVSLRVRLARDGQLPVPEALAIGAQLASALDELHRAGLLHRDLKPGHVLLQPQPSGVPKVVVVDAGVAAPIESETVFDVVGTPGYVSPEQASGKLVSFRSDLYALGCVLFEMVTGKPPYVGTTDEVLQAHAQAALPAPPSQLPGGVQALLSQLLAKEPRERPFSAQQARRAIEPFLPEAGSPRDPTVSFEPQEHGHVNGDSSKGSGTLRPPERKATLLGMPAVGQPVSKPPPPPKEQGMRPSSATPSKPPPPPGTAKPSVKSTPPPPPGAAPAAAAKPHSADSTQELDALDIEEVPAPVVPQAAGTPAQPPAAAQDDGLDYDDLEETTLHVSKDMEIGEEMPQPVQSADQPIPPTQGMPAVEVDQSQLEQAASSFVQQQPQPEQSGGFAAQQPAGAMPVGALPAYEAQPAQESQGVWEAQQAPEPTADVDVEDEPAVPKKKSRTGMIVLFSLLFFCLGSAAVGGGVWWYINDKAQEGLASLEGELQDLGTGPTTAGTEPSSAGAEQGTPGNELAGTEAAGTEAAQAAGEQPAEAAQAAGEQPAEAAEEQPTEAAEEQPAEHAAATEEHHERETASAREERHERETASAREERSGSGGSGGGASTFQQLREEAREHIQHRRFAQAVAAYERAVAMNPRHAGSWAGLGYARGANGDFRGAVAAYQKAVELQPNHSGFNAALGRAYLMSGDRARARQAYQRALALDPNNNAARQALENL